MMQNAVNESFWDAQNVEIDGRSIFEKEIELFGKIVPGEKNSIFDALGGRPGVPRGAMSHHPSTQAMGSYGPYCPI